MKKPQTAKSKTTSRGKAGLPHLTKLVEKLTKQVTVLNRRMGRIEDRQIDDGIANAHRRLEGRGY